jgi:glycolate oxidase FAD binding subunit
MRDLVIGMKMVLATGERVKTGGKVVKNVAGYDLAKLFIGSLGTLGVITELTFRVSPLPEVAASFVATGTMERCLAFAKEISGSPLLPSALVIAGNGGGCRVAAWMEGFEEATARHMRDLTAAAGRAGLEHGVLREAAHESLWRELGGFGWRSDGILSRLTVPAGAIEKILSQSAASSALRGYTVHYGSAALWVLLQPSLAGLEAYRALAAAARGCRGHAIIASAPPVLKHNIDVWGEPSPILALMRNIKHQFDPDSILNPGRFIDRI